MRPPKYDKQVGRPSKKRKKNPLEEEDGTRLSRHGVVGHCSVCNGTDHNKRKCPKLGRGPLAGEHAVQQPSPIETEPQAPSAAEPAVEQPVAQPETEPRPQTEAQPEAQPQTEPQPPKKMPVKRMNSAKVN
jgi:hypothetical protein